MPQTFIDRFELIGLNIPPVAKSQFVQRREDPKLCKQHLK